MEDWLVSAPAKRLVPSLLMPLLSFYSVFGGRLPTQPMNASNKLYRQIHIKRRHYRQNEAIMQETKALTSPPKAWAIFGILMLRSYLASAERAMVGNI